jgi:putative SOS response-associated peptidase YedK
MCGRMTLTRDDVHQLVAELEAELGEDDARLYRPRYNVAPSDRHWILRVDGDARVLVPATWGYLASGRPLINVRSEQVASGRGFREAFQTRRCAVVTDGFFEWNARREPTWFHRTDGGLVLLAGLFHQQPLDEASPPRFTVLTTRPNLTVGAVHDRMPVALDPRDPAALDDWLRADAPTKVTRLLAPARDDLLVGTPVSRRVNSVRVDDPSCLAPPDSEPPPAQTSLF